MNKEKHLVRLFDVPKHITIDEICREVTSIVNLTYLGAKDLAGVVMRESEKRPTIANDHFIYFLNMGNIERFKAKCKQEGNKQWLYILNHRIEVIFPTPEDYWYLSSLDNHNGEECKKELCIITSKYQNVTDILDKLPYYLKNSSPKGKINSIVQSKLATYLKFAVEEDAGRAKNVFERNGFRTHYSLSYTFVCNERHDETMRASTSTSNQNVQQRVIGQNQTASVIISSQSLPTTRNKTITLGVINMSVLLSLFNRDEDIHISLRANDTITPEDTVIINEDVELTDAN